MKRRLSVSLVAAAFAALIVLPTRANIVDFTGSTTGGPTYNRLLEDLSALSAVGTSVAYRTVTVNVSVSGTYTFLSTARFDNFTFLYQNTFNAATPLVNATHGSDDLLGLTTSGFAADLVAGTDYIYVTTGFGNADFGAFSETIGGPGVITSSPLAPAPSNIFTFTGNTAGGPTFNRPLEDLSALSMVGTSVRYSVFDFGVTVSGDYTFLNTSACDGFDFLYANSFNPLAPLTNAIVANDDLLGLTTSGFVASLVAGTHYFMVSTAFGNADFGAFSNTIGGPGAIVTTPAAVPEPHSVLLIGLALAMIGYSRRLRPPQAVRDSA
jgi:hypothetical protein